MGDFSQKSQKMKIGKMRKFKKSLEKGPFALEFQHFGPDLNFCVVIEHEFPIPKWKMQSKCLELPILLKIAKTQNHQFYPESISISAEFDPQNCNFPNFPKITYFSLFS